MELASVIYGVAAIALVTLPAVVYSWMFHAGHERKEFEAANPYPEVEPPQVPARCRYVHREQLDEHCRGDVKSFVEGVYKRPPADDLDPQIGDLVVAYVEVDNGKQDRVMARVLWPRATYVRARLHGMPKQDNAGSGLGRGFVDIPRSAIAGVVHMTGPTRHVEYAAGT